MKVGKTQGVSRVGKERPKCPRCGRILTVAEIRALRQGKVIVCKCEGVKK